MRRFASRSGSARRLFRGIRGATSTHRVLQQAEFLAESAVDGGTLSGMRDPDQRRGIGTLLQSTGASSHIPLFGSNKDEHSSSLISLGSVRCSPSGAFSTRMTKENKGGSAFGQTALGSLVVQVKKTQQPGLPCRLRNRIPKECRRCCCQPSRRRSIPSSCCTSPESALSSRPCRSQPNCPGWHIRGCPKTFRLPPPLP